MSAPAWRTLAVCADDFGLAPEISAGIARLARAGRLTSVSCIVNAPYWVAGLRMLDGMPPAHAPALGLHLNLTQGRPCSPALARIWPSLPRLGALMLRAHLGHLPRVALQAEVQAQLDAFQAATGQPPAFVDGHQHVHQLPGLRGIVLDAVVRIWPRPAVRNTQGVPGTPFALKCWFIRRSGGQALACELARRNLARNPALVGAYDFRSQAYRALVQHWLARLPASGGMLFCHPGEAAAAGHPADPICAARVRELAYLGSEAFQNDLDQACVRLGPVWHRARPWADIR